MERFAVEFRAEVTGNTLRGHAALFGPMAKLPQHYERMAPGVFDKVLKDEGTDVRALINHNPTLLLGRQSAGTLRLHADDRGLAFEVDLPDTSYARDLRELVARGDLTGASFGFVPGEDTWERAPDGRQIRTHTSIAQLVDVSPVTYPAYEDTAVALRHIEFTRPSRADQLIRVRARVLFARKEG